MIVFYFPQIGPPTPQQFGTDLQGSETHVVDT